MESSRVKLPCDTVYLSLLVGEVQGYSQGCCWRLAPSAWATELARSTSAAACLPFIFSSQWQNTLMATQTDNSLLWGLVLVKELKTSFM